MKFYQQEKKKSKINIDPKIKYIILGVFLGLVIIILSSFYFVAKSPIFKIKNIEISGVAEARAKILEDQLKDFMAKKSFASEKLGWENILVWGNNSEVFLKNHPELEDLKISNQYYKKQISIIAKEREKFGIWCQGKDNEFSVKQEKNSSTTALNNATSQEILIDSNKNLLNDNKSCWWFDKNGFIFSQAPIIESELFNRVEDYSGRNLSAGEKVLDDKLFGNLIKIFNILNMTQINTKTLYLSKIELEEVYIKSVSDPKILFTIHSDPSFAINAIAAIKKSANWKKLNYVDLRIQNKAYYK